MCESASCKWYFTEVFARLAEEYFLLCDVKLVTSRHTHLLFYARHLYAENHAIRNVFTGCISWISINCYPQMNIALHSFCFSICLKMKLETEWHYHYTQMMARTPHWWAFYAFLTFFNKQKFFFSVCSPHFVLVRCCDKTQQSQPQTLILSESVVHPACREYNDKQPAFAFY